MVIRTRIQEFEAFISQPENADRLLELINGEIVEKVPTEEHGIIAAILARVLGNYQEEHQIRGYVAVEARHQIPEDKDNSFLPDVSFRLTDEPRVKKGAVSKMPDLAVEIQSENDSITSLREKAAYYLQNGSRLVWLVLRNQSVKVCTPGGEVDLSEDELLTGGDVLPDFKLPVKKLFS